MFGASHKDPCAMFRLGLSSKGGNMALRIYLHICLCQRFEIWDPADFFSVQLPKILRPFSYLGAWCYLLLLLFLETPLSSSPKIPFSTVLILWDDTEFVWFRKDNITYLSLPFSGHLRISVQPSKILCDPAPGCCSLDHSRVPELRGAQPLVNKQDLLWSGREVALKLIRCLLTESFLWKFALYMWKDFVGREWGREKKTQGEELSHVHYETI